MCLPKWVLIFDYINRVWETEVTVEEYTMNRLLYPDGQKIQEIIDGLTPSHCRCLPQGCVTKTDTFWGSYHIYIYIYIIFTL